MPCLPIVRHCVSFKKDRESAPLRGSVFQIDEVERLNPAIVWYLIREKVYVRGVRNLFPRMHFGDFVKSSSHIVVSSIETVSMTKCDVLHWTWLSDTKKQYHPAFRRLFITGNPTRILSYYVKHQRGHYSRSDRHNHRNATGHKTIHGKWRKLCVPYVNNALFSSYTPFLHDLPQMAISANSLAQVRCAYAGLRYHMRWALVFRIRIRQR